MNTKLTYILGSLVLVVTFGVGVWMILQPEANGIN